MTETEIEKALSEIRASFAFEGMILDEEDEKNCRDVLSGKVTDDEKVKEILRKHGYDKSAGAP